MKWLAVLLLLLCGGSAHAYSSGAPSQACSTLTPGHGGLSQSSPSPYNLDLSIFYLYSDGNYYYIPGQTYQLTLSGATFKGFLIQARQMADDSTLTGSFSDPASGSQLSSCTPPAAGLTHTSSSDKQSITGTWTAPPLGTGPIRFRFAVVEDMPIYWANIMSDVVYESGTNLVLNSASLANNSLVVRGGVGEGENGITCTSENVDCCSDPDSTASGWFSPTGDPLHEGADGATHLYLTRGPGFVRLNRITGGTSALYWCDVPDYSGDLQRLYVGLYTNDLTTGIFFSVEVVFEIETEVAEDPPQFSLTCISEGGPVTNVLWEKEGETIEDDASHSSSQIVVNAVDAIYHNVLVVTGRNGGQYTCTVSNARTSFGKSIAVEVGTEATNLTAVQQDISGTSIEITWGLPSSPTPTVSGFTVIYDTSESSGSLSVAACTECEATLPGLTTGLTYRISIITESAHLPSTIVGSVNVTLATGCVDLGYADGCCVAGDTSCALDLVGNDCYCSEQCYSLGNCCPDILLSCPPPADADLCSLFRGYECDENAQCVSVGGEVTDSSSYLCACSDGYIGDGNTTCLRDTVVSSLSAVLATNGSSATVTCEASFFPDSPHYWIITRNGVNETVAVGKTLELDQILFDAAGDRYQCIVETQYGDISSNLVEIIVSPEGGVSVDPVVASTGRGDLVTLTCSALGGPRNSILWVQTSSGQQLSSEVSLTLNVSSGADGGPYRCSVTNEAGNGNAEAVINVAPVFDLSPTSAVAEIGSDISLQCAADGYPVPTIQWLHYDTVIRETANVTINEETVNSTVIVSTLEISGLRTVQYGQYHCRASGAVDSEPATLSFTGNITVDDCEEFYNLSTNLTSVSTTGTVCFQCPSSNPLIDDQSSSSSLWITSPDGFVAVFQATQTFSSDSATRLLCLNESIAIEFFVILQDIPPPTVVLTASSSDSVVGQSLTLTCSVTSDASTVSPPQVEILDQSGDPVATGGNIQIGGPMTVGAVTAAEIEFLSLSTSDGGRYTCRATVSVPGIEDLSAEAGIDVIVTLPEPVVTVVPANDSTVPYAAVEYGLVCRVDSNEAYTGTGAEAMVVWRNNEGQPIMSDARVTVSDTERMAGGVGYRLTLTFSPLSLTDGGEYVCSVVIAPDPSWTFVAASSPGEDSYTLNVTAPPPPTLTVSVNGSGVAGQPLGVVCVSAFIQDLLRPPSVRMEDSRGVKVEGLRETVGEGQVTVLALLDPLLVSHGGVFTCVSTYIIPEAGLTDVEQYSTTKTTTVTVSIPTPQLFLEPLPNETYIGTATTLQCTIQLDGAVDLAIQVNTSITASSGEPQNLTAATKLSNSTYQSSLVFRPLTSEDGKEYVCNATVISPNEYVTGASALAMYSLTPIDTPEPTVTVSLEQPPAVLGTNNSLVCRVMTVPGLLHPPIIDWQEIPDPDTTAEGEVEGEGDTFWRSLYFAPTLEEHGGNYTCSVTLSFPSTTIPLVSATTNYTLTVQAPVPEVEIAQDPEGDVRVETAVSLECTATLPQSNSLTFSVTVRWTDKDMSPASNSSNGRVVITPTVQRRPNEFVSRLTISDVSSQLDSAYSCTAETSVEDPGEFVTTQPVTETLSLTLIGPPTDFVVEERTQSSLSFSWGSPVTPGALSGYHLQCRAMLTGVSDPLPVSTTEQSAMLSSLHPGVQYSCTLTAVTVSNIPPSVTITATTLESAPTGLPLGLTAEAVGPRNISFTWQPLEPQLQNGVITSYTVTCSPSPLSPLPPVNEAGTLTLGGFSPLTSYNCSVRAVNSGGSGPPAYVSLITEDDTILFQVKLLGVGNCVSWKAQDEEAKLADITSAIVDNINKGCECSFTSDSVIDGVFQCFGFNSDSVTFRGGLQGLANVDSSTLAGHVAAWVATGPTILLQNVHFQLDSGCQDKVVIEDLLRPECAPTAVGGSSSGSLSAGAAAGVTITSIVVVVALVAIVFVIVMYWRRWHMLKVSELPRDADPFQEKGSTVLVRSHRASTTSVDSNKMVYHDQYQSTSFSRPHTEKRGRSFTDNPLYANPAVAVSDMAKAKQGTPLPLIPEETDGYAAILPVNIRDRSISSPPPSDYLKPQLNGDKLLPPPNSTVFENRSSGIYEDPDYTPTPKRRSASESSKVSRTTAAAAAAINVGGVKNMGGAEPVSVVGGVNVGAGEYEEPTSRKNSTKL